MEQKYLHSIQRGMRREKRMGCQRYLFLPLIKTKTSGNVNLLLSEEEEGMFYYLSWLDFISNDSFLPNLYAQKKPNQIRAKNLEMYTRRKSNSTV